MVTSSITPPPEPTMTAKQTALDASLARTAGIHAKLERLQQLADDHFGHDPDAIHWGHVGDPLSSA